MLHLLLDAGPDTYALATASVVKVVSCALLKSAPAAPPAVAGILNVRGQPVPVLDCGILLAGHPCPLRFSTRIAIHCTTIDGRERLIGLLGENLTRVQNFEEEDFIEPGARAPDFPCAGRIAALGDKWIQRLHPESILTTEVWDSLTTEPV